MARATITSKGQVTIPALVRADLHIGPGDRLEFIKLSDNRYEVVAATRDVSCIKGMVKASKSVSIETMDKAIQEKAGR